MKRQSALALVLAQVFKVQQTKGLDHLLRPSKILTGSAEIIYSYGELIER
jgi:hypothetical protein